MVERPAKSGALFNKKGKYCIFTEGREDLTGVGNFIIELTADSGEVLMPMVMLDSNMYGEGCWFYSGFDRIHDDQVDWCMERLKQLQQKNTDIKAMAFFQLNDPPKVVHCSTLTPPFW